MVGSWIKGGARVSEMLCRYAIVTICRWNDEERGREKVHEAKMAERFVADMRSRFLITYHHPPAPL